MLQPCQLWGVAPHSFSTKEAPDWCCLLWLLPGNGNMSVLADVLQSQHWAENFLISRFCMCCCLLPFPSLMSRLTCIALLFGFKKFWLWICVCISLITARFKLCNLFKESLQSLTDKERLLCSYHIQCLYSLPLLSDHTGNVISHRRNAVCWIHSFLLCTDPASGSLYFWKISHLLIYSLHEIPKVKMLSLSFSWFCFSQMFCMFCICLFDKMSCRSRIQWGDFYGVKERRRGVEALLFVLLVFCWERCKPLMCDYSFPPREQAGSPALPHCCAYPWLRILQHTISCSSGSEIQLFVWDLAVSPPPSLPLVCFCFGFLLICFFSTLYITEKLATCFQFGRVIPWRFLHPILKITRLLWSPGNKLIQLHVAVRMPFLPPWSSCSLWHAWESEFPPFFFNFCNF